MKTLHPISVGVPLFALLTCPALPAEEPRWTSQDHEGALEARFGETALASWQSKPLANPKGGEKFAASAFLHPLKTPSGFEWCAIQPDDHLHHFGLWWPWKFIETEGEKFNTWEIQEAQGAHRALWAETLSTKGGVQWKLRNRTFIRKPGAEDKAVIDEDSTIGISVRDDMEIVDIEIRQKAVDQPVTITDYRYSGFSWRGPLSWHKDNSTMTTSEGKDRDSANGTPAKWVVVSGPTPSGKASVLMMSAATGIAGTPEKLRVWDSKNLNGMPFVNFNPVMDKALPLDDAHPAVSKRKYRVIAADHVIDAKAAETEWKKWTSVR